MFRIALLLAVPHVLALRLQRGPDETSARNELTPVINALEELKNSYIRKHEATSKVHEKEKCWCDETEDAKKEELENVTTAIKQLEEAIETNEANIAMYEPKIQQNSAQIKDVSNSLAIATEIREEEHETFDQERLDAASNIAVLKDALETMKKFDALSLTQADVQANKWLAQTRKVLLQGDGGDASMIVGVFKALLENLENNARKAEKINVDLEAEFEKLKTSKSQQLAMMKKISEEKTLLLQQANSALNSAKKDLKRYQKKLEDTTVFLENDVETNCQEQEAAFAKMDVEVRETIAAIGEALALLNVEGATSLLQVRSPPSFLQVQATASSKSSGEDFTKLKGDIKMLVEQLKTDIAADEAKAKHCQASKNKMTLEVDKKKDVQEGFEALSAEKSSEIEELSGQVALLKEEGEAEDKRAKQQSEARKMEETAVKTETEVREQSLKIVDKAKSILQQKLDRKSAVFVALDKVIEDIKRDMQEMLDVAESAVSAYAKDLVDARKLEDARRAEITDKSKRIAQLEVQHSTVTDDLDGVTSELKSMDAEGSSLKEQCELFLQELKDSLEKTKFQIQQLQDAHAILSGAKLSFMQQQRHEDTEQDAVALKHEWDSLPDSLSKLQAIAKSFE